MNENTKAAEAMEDAAVEAFGLEHWLLERSYRCEGKESAALVREAEMARARGEAFAAKMVALQSK